MTSALYKISPSYVFCALFCVTRFAKITMSDFLNVPPTKSQAVDAICERHAAATEAADRISARHFIDGNADVSIVIESYDIANKERPHGRSTMLLSKVVPVRHLLGSEAQRKLEFLVPPNFPNAHEVTRSRSVTLWGIFKMRMPHASVESLRILPNDTENIKESSAQYHVWFDNEGRYVPIDVEFRKNNSIKKLTIDLDMEQFPLTLGSMRHESLDAVRNSAFLQMKRSRTIFSYDTFAAEQPQTKHKRQRRDFEW